VRSKVWKRMKPSHLPLAASLSLAQRSSFGCFRARLPNAVDWHVRPIQSPIPDTSANNEQNTGDDESLWAVAFELMIRFYGRANAEIVCDLASSAGGCLVM
jgi:hypothetical protein